MHNFNLCFRQKINFKVEKPEPLISEDRMRGLSLCTNNTRLFSHLLQRAWYCDLFSISIVFCSLKVEVAGYISNINFQSLLRQEGSIPAVVKREGEW